MANNYAEYKNCAKNGGKLVTKQLKNGRFIKICYDKDGKPHTMFFKKRKNNVENEVSVNSNVKNQKRHNKPNKPKVTKPTSGSIKELAIYFSRSRL